MSQHNRLGAESALAIHAEQLACHGRLAGVRDPGALESALARPINAAAYGEPDLADLAAADAFGIARNHPFSDGNKRTAWVVARTFVETNGATLRVPTDAMVSFTLALAAGELSEAVAAEWFRARIAG